MTDLPIPAIALEDCGAILGRRGAGKSATKTLFFEHELDAGHRCCLIDPKGDGWGVRLNPDGSPSRFQNVPIFGGSHGDMALDERQGAQLGKLIAEHDLSCVVDLSGFPSVAAMRRFARDFAEALFQANTQPLTLFVDEADQLAPQSSAARQDGPVAMLLHHMEALIRQGRQRGIFMWMLTQRPQVLNKNLLSQAETLVAMKMTTPHDRKAIRDWMDAHDPDKAKEVERQLASLGVGEAFVWVPAADFLERVQFPLFSTYDSGRTPRHGETINRVELPPIDLAAVREAMAIGDDDEPDTAAPADGGAVKKLRARIAALEAERDEWAVERGYGQQQLDALIAENKALREIAARISAAVSDMARIKPALDSIPAQGGGGPEVDEGQTEGRQVMMSAAPRAQAPAPAARTAKEKAGGGNASPAALAIADLLDRVNPAKLTWSQAAAMTGRKAIGGNFNAARKWLRESGRIVEAGDLICSASDAPAGMTRAEAIDLWCSVLSNPAPRMIEALVALGGLTKEGIGEAIGAVPRVGNFNNGLAQLRRNGLIYEYGSGTIKLVEPLPGEAL